MVEYSGSKKSCQVCTTTQNRSKMLWLSALSRTKRGQILESVKEVIAATSILLHAQENMNQRMPHFHRHVPHENQSDCDPLRPVHPHLIGQTPPAMPARHSASRHGATLVPKDNLLIFLRRPLICSGWVEFYRMKWPHQIILKNNRPSLINLLKWCE
jgi:hypothetical protein